MITPNHGLSGLICAQVAMPLLRDRTPLSERAMTFAVFLGAMLPDGDIFTRWLVGRGAYFSGAWYAHRGLSHSLGGTLVIALIAAALLYRPLAGRRPAGDAAAAPIAQTAWHSYAWLVACLWAGGLIHIFGDLFTPGWQMPVWWPLTALGERMGGWRHIGWFSPYLLVLFVTTIALGLGLRLGLGWWRRRTALTPNPPLRGLWRAAPVAVWGLYAVAGYRWVHFLVTSRYSSNSQWAEFQADLLPEALIQPVARGIFGMWHWLTG